MPDTREDTGEGGGQVPSKRQKTSVWSEMVRPTALDVGSIHYLDSITRLDAADCVIANPKHSNCVHMLLAKGMQCSAVALVDQCSLCFISNSWSCFTLMYGIYSVFTWLANWRWFLNMLLCMLSYAQGVARWAGWFLKHQMASLLRLDKIYPEYATVTTTHTSNFLSIKPVLSDFSEVFVKFKS